MGAINEVFSQCKLSFAKIEEILKILLNQNKNKSQNITTLHEMGFLNEYSYIKDNKSSNEVINFSKKNKSIKKFVSEIKLKENFIKWTKFFFDINVDDLESEEICKKKIENFTKKPLNRSFFQENIKKYMFKNKSFNKLIKYGIPKNFREFIWDIIISQKYTNNKYFNYEEEQKIYNNILKNVKSNSQIEKDLNRTFMNEKEKTPKNIEKLRNILNCISKYNNGYCQGMNYIARFLLEISNFDEVQTFYIYKNILNDINGYFEDDFPLLKKNLDYFDNLFQKLNPKLYRHFKKNDIFKEILVGKWFQTLFILSLPFDELCTIWDNLLYKGFDFIIFISLAILDTYEDKLLELNDSSDILSYLQNILDPKDISFTNKKQLEEIEEEKHHFIPLYRIITKANEIEKIINEDNNNIFPKRSISDKNSNKSNIFTKINNIDNHNDIDSECSKETERKSYSSKSSSGSSIVNNKLTNPNMMNIQNNINNLKNNLSYQKHVKYNSGNIPNSQTFYFSEKSRTYPLINDNNNTIKRNSNNFDISNFNINNGTNFNGLNNYNLRTNPCIYYNINSNIINNGPQYTNYMIYYA